MDKKLNKMIYLKKIISQDIERTPTFSIEAINDFFKINLNNGGFTFKDFILTPKGQNYKIKFQKRETRDEYRIFLNDLFKDINPSVGDIIIIRKINSNTYSCEVIKLNNPVYKHYDHLFDDKNNHQIVINEKGINYEFQFDELENFLNEFMDWFISQDGSKHNYYKDFFSNNREKLKSELLNYELIYKNEFGSDIFNLNPSNLKNEIVEIDNNLRKEAGDFFEYSSKKSNHMPRAILGKRNYLKFLEEKINNQIDASSEEFIELFKNTVKLSGLKYDDELLKRLIGSLLTKPFVILTGLSGSGKTKLAQAFVQWICKDKNQYRIIPVGADWTNREPLLGYQNGLDPENYVKPENGVLELIISASENPNLPYFLILDEMNLSHVERYFADFLSAMESDEEIPLHSSDENKNGVPKTIGIPKNLFIIGTVNIDETTHMFSPKVLDRANTIEFRISKKEMEEFFSEYKELNMDVLTSGGSNMAGSFVSMALNRNINLDNKKEIQDELLKFFEELSKTGTEFGYRTASEILRFINNLKILDPDIDDDSCMDYAIMQKLLPKLHGSRRKLSYSLKKLAELCCKDIESKDIELTILDQDDFNDIPKELIKYPVSLEKIYRMYKSAVQNGFASYAEA